MEEVGEVASIDDEMLDVTVSRDVMTRSSSREDEAAAQQRGATNESNIHLNVLS